MHGAAAPHPAFAANLPAANLLMAAQAQMHGLAAPSDTAPGLDAALSTANSVLAPSMAEPPDDGARPSAHVPEGIFNAFSNPSGNNFSSAVCQGVANP